MRNRANLKETICEILEYKKEASTSQITDELNSRSHDRLYSPYNIYPLLDSLRKKGRVKSRIERESRETHRNGKLYKRSYKAAFWSLTSDGQ